MNTRFLALTLTTSLAAALSGCPGSQPVKDPVKDPEQDPGIPSVVGTLIVTVGFGAAGNYMCTGQGAISVEPISLTGTGGKDRSDQASYQFSGFSKNESPACTATVNFEKLRAGTWRVAINGNRTVDAIIRKNSFTTLSCRTENFSCTG